MPINRAQLAFAALVSDAQDPITPTVILPDGTVKLGTFNVEVDAPAPVLPFMNAPTPDEPQP